MANKYKSQERTGILTPDECVLRELFGIEYDLFNQLGLVNLENTRKVKIDNLEIPKFYRATISENIIAFQINIIAYNYIGIPTIQRTHHCYPPKIMARLMF